MRKAFQTIGFSVLALLLPAVTNAQVTLLPQCAVDNGRCSTCDMMALFLNFAELLTIWISGAVLVSFIFGGVLWITSAGVSERVQRGKQVMIGAVIGLFLVGGGYTIVNFSIGAIVGQENLNEVQLFGTNWNEFCKEQASADVNSDTASSTNVCDGLEDGTTCTEEGNCSESGICQCQSGQCVLSCTVEATSFSDDRRGDCVETITTCDNRGGTVYSSGQDCPGFAPVCCQTTSQGGAICQRSSETECNESCIGNVCEVTPGAATEGYVCGRGDTVGQCITKCQFQYAPNLAFCLPEGNTCAEGFISIQEDGLCSTAESTCCVQPSQ